MIIKMKAAMRVKMKLVKEVVLIAQKKAGSNPGLLTELPSVVV
jgi:hypothetical protein